MMLKLLSHGSAKPHPFPEMHTNATRMLVAKQ